MKKKLLSMAAVTYFTVCFMLLFGVNANAYIDPSVITYLIQAIAGVVIAIGAVVGGEEPKRRSMISSELMKTVIKR